VNIEYSIKEFAIVPQIFVVVRQYEMNVVYAGIFFVVETYKGEVV